LKKNIFPLNVVIAVLLCFAANGVVTAAVPGLPFNEDFADANLKAALTTANWSASGVTLMAFQQDNTRVNAHFPGWGAAANITADANSSRAASLGDVDGNGFLDLVVANYEQRNRLYTNDGTGVFSGDYIGSESDKSTAIALGDVDGDGDLDVVVANDSQTNKLYLNNGSGVFSAAGINIGRETDASTSVALGDVDADGDLDLLVGNNLVTNKLYLNDGNAVFSDAGVSFSSAVDATTCIALADVDADGDLDLMVGNAGGASADKRNKLYRNDGKGDFSSLGESIGSGDAFATQALVFGDVDSDGDLDLVVANEAEKNRLYLNDGSGAFLSAGAALGDETDVSRGLDLVDVDSDGDVDLVVGNDSDSQTNKLYRNDGKGGFDASGSDIGAATNRSQYVSLGDMDGDGDLDLIVINRAINNDQTNLLYKNGGSGGFSVSGAVFGDDDESVTSVAVADLDNDEDEDVVVGMYNQPNKVYLNDGSGGFSSVGLYVGIDNSVVLLPVADADATYSISLGDVGGGAGVGLGAKDGFPDIVVGNYGQSNKIYLNDGDGSGEFSSPGIIIDAAETDATYSVALADIGSIVAGLPSGILDGNPDVVVGNNHQENKLYLYDSANKVFFAGTGISSDVDYTYAIALADVDGVNGPDLIAANSGQVNKVYLNTGAGGFGVGAVIGDQINLEKDGSTSLAVIDVDGVNGLDIVVGNFADVGKDDEGNKKLFQANKLYLNNDSGGFLTAGIVIGVDAEADNTSWVDTGDVNMDGCEDLVVGNDKRDNAGQTNKLYLSDCNGGFLSPGTVLGLDTDDTRFIKLADFNNDDYLELLVGNYARVSKLHNNVIYRTDAGRVVSKPVNSVADGFVRTARLTASATVNGAGSRNTWIDYYLSNDGGLKWYQVESGADFIFPLTDFFPPPNTDLRWKAELHSLSPVRTPALTKVVIEKTNVLPEFTVTPSIEGVFAVGETLTVINTAATDAEGGGVVVSYKWLANNAVISGVTAATYVIPSEMVNASIKVEVTATDSEGGEVMVITNTVNSGTFVAPPPDPNAEETVVEDANSVVKRSGGAGLGGLALLGLMLLSVWRVLTSRCSKRLVAPIF